MNGHIFQECVALPMARSLTCSSGMLFSTLIPSNPPCEASGKGRVFFTRNNEGTARGALLEDEGWSSSSESEDEVEQEDVDVERRTSDEGHITARPHLMAPIRDLIADAVKRGYAKYNSLGLARATANPRFVSAKDSSIVKHYSAVINVIVKYYSFVNKRSSLWKVTSIYRKSCALTLARKHSLRSSKAAFNKYGPNLKISEPDREPVILYYPDSLKTTGKFNTMSARYSEVTILQEPYDKRARRVAGFKS